MQTTKQIKAGWNPGERDTAHCHLYNYGVIFLDGLGKPVRDILGTEKKYRQKAAGKRNNQEGEKHV